MAAEDQAAGVDAILADIHKSQQEMGGTLGQLRERLDPPQLLQRAKDSAREATIGRVEKGAKETSDMVMKTIKRNPIPAALAGAGLAMLWANRAKDHDIPKYRHAGYYSPQHGGGQEPPGLGDRVSSAAASVGGSVSDAVGQVRQSVGGVGDSLGQTAGQVGGSLGETVGQVGSQLDQFMQASPLAMGAIALGAGAVIGALLPPTPQEREVLGDASRQVGSVVSDTVEEATTKAHQALDQAEEKVTSQV